MTERADAIVIGAGHNGLVCAAYLARAGLDTVILEASDRAGGMASAFEFADGFRAPGLAHVAFPLAATIRRDLDLDACGYAPGPAAATVALAPGLGHRVIDAAGVTGDGLPAADRDAWPAFRQRYLDFAGALQPLTDSAPPRLRDMPFRDKTTLAKLGWRLRAGLGRDAMVEFLRVAGMNVYDVLDEAFGDEVLKGALAAEAVMGSAMGPRTPGTVLTWLQWLAGARNGPQTLCGAPGPAAALATAAESAGATLRLDAPVRRIRVGDGRAQGVELADGERLDASLVVSAVDPRATFTRLVGARNLDAMFAHRVTQIRGRGVVGKLLLGLDGLPGFAGLDAGAAGARLFVAPSMRHVERAFNPSKYGEYPAEPVLDVTVPSTADASLAPAGKHVMSVNVAFVPYAPRDDRPGTVDEFVRAVVRRLDACAPGLERQIVASEFLTPADIEARWGAVEGHWHHGELTMHQSFMLRPLYRAAQYDTPVDGLYLASAGCHPGGGLTGLPGRNAARRILEQGGAR